MKKLEESHGLSCVADFWKLQWNAIRACLCCHETQTTPSIAKSCKKNDESYRVVVPYDALLSTYDIV